MTNLHPNFGFRRVDEINDLGPGIALFVIPDSRTTWC